MAQIPISINDDGEATILEQPEDEPETNLPGLLLGLALFPFAVLLAVMYIKVVLCAIVHVWHWVSF
jgi:hypothetical protein